MPYHARTPHPATARLLRTVGFLGRNLRVAEGLSQRELERLSGVDQTTISRFERGLAPGLRLERVATIMAVLGVDHLRSTTGSHDHR